MSSHHRPPQHHRTSIRQQQRIISDSSTSWKIKLKQKCLERAREKRKDAVWIQRGFEIDATNKIATTNPNNNANKTDMLELVAKEVRDAGVGIIPSSSSSNNNNNNPSTPCRAQNNTTSAVLQFSPNCRLPFTNSTATASFSPSPMFHRARNQNDVDDASMIPLVCQDDDNRSFSTPPSKSSTSSLSIIGEEYYNYQMSEDELYELMNEIEEELQQEEAYFMEGVKALEEQEALMEEQISNYYDENNHCAHDHHRDANNHAETMILMNQSDDPDDVMETNVYQSNNTEMDVRVVCPICQNNFLIQNHNNHFIHCSNCSFQIQPKHPITLLQLSERFRNIYQDHSYHCNGVLLFRMHHHPNNFAHNATTATSTDTAILLAECGTCHKSVSVFQ